MPKATGPENKKSPTKRTSSTSRKKVTAKKVGTKRTANSSTKKATTTRAQQAVTKAEKQVNKAVANVSQKIEKKVTPEFRQKATKFASQADKFAGEVEAVGEELEQIAEHILPSGAGSSAMFVASYDKNVSRLFIFRCLWLIIQGPIISIRTIRYLLVTVIHILYMFFVGQRNKALRKKQTRFRRHIITRRAYLNAIVDHRPELIVD